MHHRRVTNDAFPPACATGGSDACRIDLEAGKDDLMAQMSRILHVMPIGSTGRCGMAIAACFLVAGCVDGVVTASAPPAPTPVATNQPRREGVSPSGATVAMVSFGGGPTDITQGFTNAFDAAARTQGIVMALPGAADYFVRVYLNAVPENDHTALTYVLDVFNAKKQRMQRIEDRIMIKARAADPWSVVDSRALAAAASKSAAELAAVLTNTPEAIMAAAKAAKQTKLASAVPTGSADTPAVIAATPPPSPSSRNLSAASLR